MTRSSSKLLLLIAISGMGVLGYSLATRKSAVEQDVASNTLPSAQAINPSISIDAASSSTTASMPSTASVIYPADIVAKWAEERTDASARAAEMDALANASRSQAIPVLQRVLIAGDDADRQHAVSALHALALHQGDTDGTIRDVLRQAVFHDDGAVIADDVQAALADIERNLDQSQTRSSP